MELLDIEIRQLTREDFEAVQRMDTGIVDDYVLRIFPHSVAKEATYGAFCNGQLLSMAAYTVFAGHYAVLGRVRTDRRYRGLGLSTKLLSELCRLIDRSPKLHWVGLATELNNLAVHHISEKLGLSRLSVYTSNVLSDEGLNWLLRKAPSHPGEWLEVTDVEEKRNLLNGFEGSRNPLHIFPYECYYPLPFEAPLWTEDYLTKCRFLRSKDRFVLLMEDDKGDSYLHVKYFFNDFFSDINLLSLVAREAEKQRLRVWVDLPYLSLIPEEFGQFLDSTTWTCWGRKTSQIG